MRRDLQNLRGDIFHYWHLHYCICERRDGCKQTRDDVEISKDIITQRSAMEPVISIIEFIFQLRHIHAGGTFRFASLAAEAQIESIVSCLLQLSLPPPPLPVGEGLRVRE